jgi:phosphomannomutase
VRLGPAGEEPLDLPRSDALIFELDGGGKIIARPSGTEPKIKFYFELREPLGRDEPFAAAQARADARMERLTVEFVKAAEGSG